MAPPSSSKPVYSSHSPSQSTTSLSENDDDDANKSLFFPGSNAVAVSPAHQWSSRLQRLPNSTSPSSSSMSHLPPEILIQILKHLHSPRDLYHALLVSRSWCECSVELLWHRPSFSRLSTLVKVMRVICRQDQTFTYASFIRRLNFIFLGAELSDVLFSRLSLCDRLERLTLVNCHAISNEALSRVLPQLPNLVALDLTGVWSTSDKVVVELASAAKRLQGINLTGCKDVTDIGLYALAAHCPLLRRVKLSGLDQITDGPVSAMAKACPLLLEVDLHLCKQITDVSVRDLWTHCTHMREMRLSQCTELTDAAFPASPKTDHALRANNPFSQNSATGNDPLPPLILNRRLEHLRMLDLTACSRITDDAIEGIISLAPKIRNLVLSKCYNLTDRTVDSICSLGKHLHYLHLGHAAAITDRSIKSLARCCTRLRYVDFANCVLLTDMSVFELSSLPKLRRIGLVRVSNLTDEAIYALAERHSTLERIHLSYCDQISVMAIHFLLQKLHKLTHLSLTGIPSFRKPELQQFCRPPPQEFNLSQRSAFCVYSGNGVSKLRAFLTDLFNTITEDMNADEETEYDEDPEGMYNEDAADMEMELGNEAEIDEDIGMDEPFPTSAPDVLSQREPPRRQDPIISQISRHPELTLHRDRDQTIRQQSSSHVALPSSVHSDGHGHHHNGAAPSNQRRHRGFPVMEASTSPAPSDVASNRSAGTAQSNGAGFFRTYHEAASSSRSNGALTPDYVFAEIGHGRGAGHSSGVNGQHTGHARHHYGPSGSFGSGASNSTQGIAQVMHSVNHHHLDSQISHGQSRRHDNSTSSHHLPQNSVGWPYVEASSPPPATHEELDSTTVTSRSPDTTREVDGRGRSVKRSLRNTFNVAEHYASSFLFGRTSAPNGRVHELNNVNGTSTSNAASSRS